jgi:hypothetical protein
MRRFAQPLLATVLLIAVTPFSLRGEDLPRQITDQDFWKMIADMSEPDGYFQYEYLFRDSAKDRFFASVGTLPMDSTSAMIRALGGPGGVGTGPDAVRLAPGKRWAAVKCSIMDFVKAFNAGQLQTRMAANRLCSR